MDFRIKLSLAACFLSVSTFATADEVILDDVIINGSACVGTPCINDEFFDFDTLKIKSDTPQIRFQDTSTSASFPTQDWLMGISAGMNVNSVFYIQDETSSVRVMQIESGLNGGVALGAGSEIVTGAVSVGSSGSERRIAYVADAVNNTDAVTLSQFNSFEANAAATAATDVAAVNAEISDLQAEMVLLNQRLDEVITRLNALQ
ncbi:hypothetical protein [Kangiella marina]|uniref:Trimeric autotransporter adhesin YadA-like stalk domain-containing protein n=1 Tax=Kangiella marina TaxID=1079178 RepID=A0ABP8IIY4_9GAMM